MAEQILLTEEYDVDDREGTFATDEDYDLVVDFDADVYKPSGECLLRFRKGILSPAATRAAWDSLKRIHEPPVVRYTASGYNAPDGPGRTHLRNSIRVDLSGKNPTGYLREQSSAVIGFMDRGGRFPYCRPTRWVRDNPDLWARSIPFLQEVDGALRELAPDAWATQSEHAERTHSDWVIPGTTFTTITVNKNWQSALHRDGQDLPGRGGVMVAIRAGEYTGGLTVFPRFRVAIDMGSQDFVNADIGGCLHGNTPIVGRRGKYARMTLVCYYRKMFQYALSTEGEQRQAMTRRRDGTEALWPEAKS